MTEKVTIMVTIIYCHSVIIVIIVIFIIVIFIIVTFQKNYDTLESDSEHMTVRPPKKSVNQHLSGLLDKNQLRTAICDQLPQTGPQLSLQLMNQNFKVGSQRKTQ